MRRVADTTLPVGSSATTTPVTAKEIGRRLGLSQPTVSRILAGAPGYRVAPDTRRRVIEAAQQMGYRPNAIARSLRRRRTNIVGFYTGYGYLDARNPFQAQVIGSLQRACDARQLDLLLHGVFRGASTNDILGELADGRIDGLFVITSPGDPLAAHLRASSLPVVAIADAIEGIPSVVPDDVGGTRLLLDYLWERGHRRIAYFQPNVALSSVGTRVQAFRSWAQERGLSEQATPVYELEVEFTHPALTAMWSLPSAERPTAVCCWNDMTALDLLYQCRIAGISVPEELSIVGFDGLLTDPRLSPRELVTVGASWTDIAERAMNLLVQQIDNRNGSSETETKEMEETLSFLNCLPVSLVPGDTA